MADRANYFLNNAKIVSMRHVLHAPLVGVQFTVCNVSAWSWRLVLKTTHPLTRLCCPLDEIYLRRKQGTCHRRASTQSLEVVSNVSLLNTSYCYATVIAMYQ